MFEYEATAEGTDEFGLTAMLQAYANEFWTPSHLDEQQTATMVLEACKRKMAGHLELPDQKREESGRATSERQEIKRAAVGGAGT